MTKIRSFLCGLFDISAEIDVADRPANLRRILIIKNTEMQANTCEFDEVITVSRDTGPLASPPKPHPVAEVKAGSATRRCPTCGNLFDDLEYRYCVMDGSQLTEPYFLAEIDTHAFNDGIQKASGTKDRPSYCHSSIAR